jgi:biopolymer transport protein ExbD
MSKKNTRRNPVDAGLNITSMMDMMTIILVFLLKSYSADDLTVTPSDDLMLPVSSALKAPKMAVNVIVSQTQILVDGVPVVALTRVVNEETGIEVAAVPEDEIKGQLIDALHEKLVEKAESAKSLGERTGLDEFGFKGEILLQCDRRLPFSIIRQVMYTAGQAQFSNFRFVIIKGSE